MSDLADRHRRIADIVEPFEELGIDAAVNEWITDGGDLRLTLELRIPPAFDSGDASEAAERIAELEAQFERLRHAHDGLRAEVDSVEDQLERPQAERRAVGDERDGVGGRVDAVARRTEGLGERLAILEERTVAGESNAEADHDATGGDGLDAALAGLTEGERGTLRALEALGGPSGSGEIAAEVDATIQSVRSWLPKLVEAGHIRAEPDPTDGRRKLYSPIEAEEPDGERDEGEDGPDSADDEPSVDDEGTEATDDGRPASDEGADPVDDERPADEKRADSTDDERSAGENVEGSVYIASAGGSPSQVFHVREDCPQLRKSAGFVEKDRAVVPHHRPCSNCVPNGLQDGLVAIARGSPTTTYHRREDCPKLGSAIDVAVVKRETVSNHDPCDDCVPLGRENTTDADEGNGANGANGAKLATLADETSEMDETDDGDEGDDGDEIDGTDDGDEGDDGDEMDETSEMVGGSTAARLCARDDLTRAAVVAALDGATSIYHVQRDLELSRDETETLLEALGVFEALDGGGHVTPERATAAGKQVPATAQSEPNGGGSGG